MMAGVTQRGGGTRFAEEAFDGRLVRTCGARNDFDGDFAAELSVSSPVHFAHAPGAEVSDHLIAANPGSGGNHGWIIRVG